MIFRFRAAATLLWLGAVHACAQDRAVIERVKAATALLDVDGGARIATAFCIDESGLFVANSQAFKD